MNSSGFVRPSAGIKSHVTVKSKSRRQEQRAISEVARHRPPPRNDLLPNLKLVVVPVESIHPAGRPVRRAGKAQLARVQASIDRLGICKPVLIAGNGEIIDGHLIWEAARQSGLTEVPCLMVDHLSSSEVRLLRIALNRIGETGEWDVEALAIEFKELITLGEDVVVTGFEEAEIDVLVLEEFEEGADDDCLLAGGQSPAVSELGDRWMLGDHRLLQGDARDTASYERLLLPGESARLVLTDEPYNVPNVGHVTSSSEHREFAMANGEMTPEQFAAFNRHWMRAASAHLMDGGLLATYIDWRSIDLVVRVGKELGFELLNLIVWKKSNGGQGSLWRSQHELLPVFKKGSEPHVNNVELGRNGRWRSNIWEYAGASSLGSDARQGLAQHPTVKPRAMLEDAILDVTHRGEIVVDCFAGSGSTLLAAEATGRHCRAIEIDGPYCDLIIRRWQAQTGQEAVLEDTGETFANVASQRLSTRDPAPALGSGGGDAE